MAVWRIWHPTYGVIYDEGEVIKRGTYAWFVCQTSPQLESPSSTFPKTSNPQSPDRRAWQRRLIPVHCAGAAASDWTKDSRYRITIMLVDTVPWRDGSIDTDLSGFSVE